MKLIQKILLTASSIATLLFIPATYVQAAVTFPVNGGTGSTTLSGLLKGNGTSPVISAVGGTDYEFPLTFSTGLNRTGNTITNIGVLSNIAGSGISVSGATGNVTIGNTGVLSFNTRTGAVTLTSGDVTTALGFTPSNFGYPFPLNATTTVLTFTNGLISDGIQNQALTTGTVNSNLVGTEYSTATTSLSSGTGISLSGTPGALIGGSNLTINNSGVTSIIAGTNISISGATGAVTINSTGGSGTGLATSSPISGSNLLVYSTTGAGSAYGVATSTLTASSPLTGSFTQIGSGGTLGCQTASGSQAGCLASADWTTFNGKQSALTFSTGLLNTGGTITNTGVLSNVAGTGISVSGATGNVTVSNTGVISNSCPGGFLSCSGTNPSSFTLGTLGTANGGTASTTALGGILVGNGTSAIKSLAIGTNLTFDGTTLNATGGGSLTGTTGQVAYFSGTNTAVGTSSIFIATTKNVGIGTVTPPVLLTVQGTTTNSGDVSFETLDSTGAFTSKTTNGGNFTISGGLTTNNAISAGSYFLGNTSNGANYLITSADEYGKIQNDFSDTWSLSHSGLSGIAKGTPDISWNTLNNVGIGSSSPYAKFSINANNGDTNTTLFAIGSSTASATTTLVSVQQSATTAFGIGTTSPASTLTVNGSVTLHGLGAGAGAGSVCATADGLLSNDVGAACIVSTEHAKHDIQTITDQQASEILNLNPVQYTYNDGSGTRYGLIAEQVAKIDPKLVIYAATDTPVTGPDGKPFIIKRGLPYTVDYDRFTGLLTAEVQRQQQEIQNIEVGKSPQDVMQDVLIGLLLLYVLYTEMNKRRKI